MKKYGYLGLDLIVCSCIASEHEIFTYQFVSDISCSIITVHQGGVAKDITEEIIMELLLHILGVGVALMLLIHQEHLVEDMEKEEVIITDLETIM